MSAITDSWDDLDEHLADVDPDELIGDTDRTDLADRMVRRIARNRRLLAVHEEVARGEIARIEEWLVTQRAALDTTFVEEALRLYHEARLARDPKAKTIHLPSGSLVARKLPDRWEFDDDAFLAWAQDRRTDLIRMRDPEVDKPAAKKALRVLDDGQIIDGTSGEFVPAVTVTPGDISFAVKTEEQDR